jgi:hypothetical protein
VRFEKQAVVVGDVLEDIEKANPIELRVRKRSAAAIRRVNRPKTAVGSRDNGGGGGV